MPNDFDLKSYREKLERANLEAADREMVRELLAQLELVTAENIRLRKTLLRVSSQNGSRMSSKLKDALYE